MSLRKIAVACGLSLSLLFVAGCSGDAPGGGGQSAAVKKVASIDESAIYGMDDFKKAEEALNKWSDDEVKKRQEAVKNKSDEEKATAFSQYQVDLQKKTNETMGPLKDKARAAIALAAKDKGVTVVLDKKIVVYGVPEITDDVKALLTKGGELTYPKDEIDPAQAPIGYFDQTIVRNLKVFKQAEMEIMAERNNQIQGMQKSFEEAGRKPTPAEIQNMQKAVEARLEALQEQKMGPLIKAVTDSVAEVAKKENLSLVLDTQHVMYGGRNLTESVVDTFLKKADGKDTTAGSSPTPEATPADGG